jgi:hypothetical protein
MGWGEPQGRPSTNGHLPETPVTVRLARRADDNWFVPGTTDYGEMVKHARHSLRRTGKPQRIHTHPLGHLCTARCRVLEGEGDS